MGTYENRQPPEGISSGRDRPIRDVVVLGGGTLALIAAVLFVVHQFGSLAAPYVPFAWEKKLGDPMVATWAAGPDDPETEARLRGLSGRLVAVMDLPEGMTVTVHHVKQDWVNAVAMLGGHIVVFEGLVEKLPDENSLAMVLAHEIAHVKHRHVARAMGGGILVALVGAALFGGEGGIVSDLAGGAGALTALRFSRANEEKADAEALAALMAVYGHVRGFREVFRTLEAATAGAGDPPPAFLSSHPLTGPRIERLEAIARRRGWPTNGPPTPLRP